MFAFSTFVQFNFVRDSSKSAHKAAPARVRCPKVIQGTRYQKETLIARKMRIFRHFTLDN